MEETINNFITSLKRENIISQSGNFGAFICSCFAGSDGINSKIAELFDESRFIIMSKLGFGEIFYSKKLYFESSFKAWKEFEIKKKDLSLYKNFQEIQKNTVEEYPKFNPIELEKFTTKKLVFNIKKYSNILNKCLAYTIFCEGLDHEILLDIIKKENIKIANFEEFCEYANLLTIESFDKRYNKVAFSKSSYYDKQWLFADYSGCCLLDEVPNKLKERFQKEEFDENVLNQKIKKSQAFKQKIFGKEKNLFEFVSFCSDLRDIRKDTVNKNVTIITNLVREFLKRLNINQNLFNFVLTIDFDKELFKSKDYKKIIQKRSKGILVNVSKEKLQELNIDIDISRKYIHNLLDESKKEIKGYVACKGLAKGNVKVVIDIAQGNKFMKGDILVTSMTRPEFVPLMKKAAAIITNEGGITSHAAIVSRELQKPCIIGTKNATRTLKDGDLVEVDANKGIVRLLKKNE